MHCFCLDDNIIDYGSVYVVAVPCFGLRCCCVRVCSWHRLAALLAVHPPTGLCVLGCFRSIGSFWNVWNCRRKNVGVIQTSSFVGVKNLLDDEAVIVGGKNHSHATKDLFDAIAAGDYPEWTLFIQTMDPADEDKFDFDPLDVTKIWPENLFPLQPVGRMVLNKNPDNFFNENEQLAFAPGLVVPGECF